MFFNFFRFELSYWLRSMMVYVFLLIISALVLAAVSSDSVQIGGSLENADRNSPYTIQSMYGALSIISIVIIAAFANGAASRDFAYNTHQILFTKPISKPAYIFGRYWGAALVAVIPSLGVSMGILLAKYMPWIEPENWGPINWSAHLWGIMVFAVPNAIIATALIFAVAVYTRSTIAAFVSAIVLIVGAAIASSLVSNLDNQMLAALADPFGETAFRETTKYWTVADRNTQFVTLTGSILANRVLWLAIAMLALAAAYLRFSFSERSSGKRKRADYGEVTAPMAAIPVVQYHHNVQARVAQLASQIKVDFFETIKSNVFIVVLFVTLLNSGFVLVFNATEGFGLTALPVTYNMIDLIRGTMYAFLIGIIAFYTGVMVWKERDAKLDEIYDALPQSTWTIFLGKLCSMIAILAIILSIGILAGVMVQAANGYTRFQLDLYAIEILGIDLLQMSFLVMLSMAAHVVSPNKYIGYFLFIVLLIANSFGWLILEVSTRMVRYGSLPEYTYSDMFRFAPYQPGLVGFAIYWILFAVLLGFASIAYWQRGRETSVAQRLSHALTRLRGPLGKWAAACLMLWVLSAGWVSYNTMFRNELIGIAKGRELRARYEREFKEQHEGVAQPSVKSVKYTIDIFPEQRGLKFAGEQIIVNRSQAPIEQLFLNFAEHLDTTVEVDNATLETAHEDLRYYIYRFDPPMAPQQQLTMRYMVQFEPQGFENSVSRPDIVQNGSFFNNSFAPQIGYLDQAELTDRGDRRKEGLAENQDLMPKLDPDDLPNRMRTYIPGADHWVDVETIISTTNSVAVAPGSLVKRWVQDGRNYFQYKLDHPSLNFYSFISADYKVAMNHWKGVDIEVYYHPEHEWNVDNMLRSIRDSLEYYTENFGPYRHKQARIIEFPRIASFAQAFPGTMPYSEGIGFIADISKKDDIDMVYYVVAHEMAHQWWAHQVVGANMQGATLLSETLAQYSALMVMEKRFGRDMMRKFLQYEMDRYLRARGREQLKERPLMFVESSQGYIHYQKGSCAMYYLKEMIGEDKINLVLKDLVDRFAYKEAPFPTSKDLIDGLREVTPDDLRYVLDDLFADIILFANRTTQAEYEQLEDGRYKIYLGVICEKFRADAKGEEASVELNDWIEIGAFAAPEPGKRYGKTLHRERKRITSREASFQFVVESLPEKVGIDPFALLIDRVPGDNLQKPKLRKEP